MVVTTIQDKMIRTVFANNLGDSIEDIVDNHPKVFDGIKIDDSFEEYLSNVYNEINNNVVDQAPIATVDNKEESYANNTADMLSTMMETIHAQQEINAEQEKKITDVSGKVDELLKFIKDTMEHPEQILKTLQQGNVKPNPQNPQGNDGKDISGLNDQGQAPPPQSNSGFTLDKVGDIVGLISQLRGMNSQQSAPTDPLASMTNGLQMATQLAGALGGALSKMFDAFDGMQNKAYNSWGKRFSGKTIDMQKNNDGYDIDELTKKIVEKMKKES